MFGSVGELPTVEGMRANGAIHTIGPKAGTDDGKGGRIKGGLTIAGGMR